MNPKVKVTETTIPVSTRNRESAPNPYLDLAKLANDNRGKAYNLELPSDVKPATTVRRLRDAGSETGITLRVKLDESAKVVTVWATDKIVRKTKDNK